MSPQRLFHLMDWEPWTSFRDGRDEEHRPASFGEEGFVHLSLARQLAGTLAVHFAEAPRLALLELDAQALGADLVLEASRAGEDFPHLYRPIRRADLLASWCLEREDGGHRLPEGLVSSIGP